MKSDPWKVTNPVLFNTDLFIPLKMHFEKQFKYTHIYIYPHHPQSKGWESALWWKQVKIKTERENQESGRLPGRTWRIWKKQRDLLELCFWLHSYTTFDCLDCHLEGGFLLFFFFLKCHLFCSVITFPMINNSHSKTSLRGCIFKSYTDTKFQRH